MRLRHLVPLLLACAACAAALPAPARLGETAADLRKRFGRPESQPAKNVSVWLIEEAGGALLYTVTFDDRNRSIAEGLKPFRQARLTEQTARNFIADQLAVLADTSTARAVKPGEAYTFAGGGFVCGEGEQVLVDEQAGVLIVWAQRAPASVLAVTAEFVQRKGP